MSLFPSSKLLQLTAMLRTQAVRGVVLLFLYSMVIVTSRWLAYWLRFDFAVPDQYLAQLWRDWPWVLALKLLCLYAFGQFAGLLSFFSVPDLRQLFWACVVPALILFGLRFLTQSALAPPRGVVLIDFILTFSGLAAVRLALRLMREWYFDSTQPGTGRTSRRVAIIGAGDAGASLARELMIKRGLGLKPVAFLDDDRAKWGSRVHDIPVAGAPEILLNQKLNLELDEAIIAMPSAPAKRTGEIVRILQQSRLKFQTVPALVHLATGKVRVTALRSVEIQDLLGRDPVKLELDDIRHTIENRVILVSGAGGSIGSELCRQIATFNPARLLAVDQSEVQMFQIEQELLEAGYGGTVLPLVADVADRRRMEHIFGRYRPEVIFHAAAHKHVPLMESQPAEAIQNNVIGTMCIAELALHHDVERFVFISTDKAINPTNVMGATKRLSEIFLQSLHASSPQRTKFMAVRFGNVLGSSGSVIPIFRRQIAQGGPVKVTHPDVTRYFMTIPEASGLVLQSAAQGAGGEIFVLDMGEPVRIVDLARQMIELSGFRPDEDIEIEFIGLRPGEKLFEELNHKDERLTPTTHPKVMRFHCTPSPIEWVRQEIAMLSEDLFHADSDQLKLRLKRIVPEYQPYLK